MSTPSQPMRRPKFDWDEARRLRATGMTYEQIAATLGVTIRAVQRVCTPGALEQSRATGKAYSRITNPAHKTLCECGRQPRWHAHRCRLCTAESQVTTVRATTLWCSRCQTWQLDNAFSWHRRHAHRRGRSDWCRACDAQAKREYRARLKAAA